METKEISKEEAEFWESPVGRARAAKHYRSTFFQIEIPHETISGYTNLGWAAGNHQVRRQHQGATDTLGEIEAEGWRLEHASWVYVQTGQNSRDKFLASGQQTVVLGEVVGMYLFRSVD